MARLLRRPGAALVVLQAVLLTAVCVGCNKPPYEIAPVTGRVLIDGRPFAGGKVQFAPVAKEGINAGKPAFGLLNEDGSFQLSTYSDGDGAVVGKHWVTLMSLPDRRSEADRSLPEFRRVPTGATPLEVARGQENEFEIDLTLDQLREYSR